MERSNHQSIAESKQINLVQYLASIGYQPKFIRGADYWYLSPFRDESTPSFKVNGKLNLWYDFGEGKGGNIIDFGIRYFHCSVLDFLKRLGGDHFSFHQPLPVRIPAENAEPDNHKIIVVKETALTAKGLLAYLHGRGIQSDIAGRFCREVTYINGGRTYYGIGFRNNSGGFEIRSKYAKLCIAPKDMTLIKNGGDHVAVFEGFMDFLSFHSSHLKEQNPLIDCLVLNSTALFDRSLELMHTYRRKDLYLDQDATGRRCTEKALRLNEGYQDRSNLYAGHKDLNDWLVSEKKQQRKGQDLRR